MRLVTSVPHHLPKGTDSQCIRDIMNCLAALTAVYLLIVISLAYGSENCQRNQFQCNDGLCILRSWRCDKENDCKDNSDEEYCELNSTVNRRYVPRRKCPSNYFSCSDYHCIPNVWKCDGIKDCADSRDENECEPAYCDMPNIFTCQNGLCISRTLVCNDVNDCKDGSDEKDCVTGILALPEVNSRRQKAANWLISKRNTRWGWNENTPRAIIAMYLSGSALFNGTNKEEELMAKQLELKVSISLLRNETDQLTPSMLAQYINALLVTCHNPHNFYGLNLVTILKKQIQNNRNKTHPLAYLTLCNANDTVSADDVNFLFEILNSKSEFPFWIDVQAAAVMALSCITKQSIYEYHSPNVTLATTRLKNQQHSDGSFGNIYTTAVVVQALLDNGHEEDDDWNLEAAVSFLKSKQKFSDGSFGDFLATYWILPIFNGKSLTSISYVQCGSLRKQRDDNPHEIVKSKLGPRIYVQYSLYIGNDLDIVHSISLRIPLNISVYNVMQLASEVDSKYKFKEKRMLDKIYIYSITDRANDPETGMFWLLYLSHLQNNGTASLSTESPDKVIVSSGEHIIMWYKLADIRQK